MAVIMEHNILGIINIKKHNIVDGSCLVTKSRAYVNTRVMGSHGLWDPRSL